MFNIQDAKLQEYAEYTTFVVGGAAAGAVVSNLLGGMGLAVRGTAVGIGMLRMAALGAVVGLAFYSTIKVWIL